MHDHQHDDDIDDMDEDHDVSYEEFMESFEHLERNPSRPGRLVLHYPARDVTVEMDGATATRVLAVHAGVSTRKAMERPLLPMLANMASAWVSIDLESVLAVSWTPSAGPDNGCRITVDPNMFSAPRP